MAGSALLTGLAILVALLTAAVYLLQTIELLEKRIPQVVRWMKKRKHKRVDTHSIESSFSPPGEEPDREREISTRQDEQESP